MAIDTRLLTRHTDQRLFLAAAALFPLLVFIGYSRTYYLGSLFDALPLANNLVRFHGLVMSLWVVYFSVQVALIRTKNVNLHISMGLAGIALATLVVVVGLATAYDSNLVRGAAPPGLDPHSFFAVPVFDMLNFVILFTAAICYRKRPTEHKLLMLMTAFNFVGAAIARIPVVPDDYIIFWAFGATDALILAAIGWHTWKHRKLNRVFAAGALLVFVSEPLRIFVSGTESWLRFTNWLAS
ncbi:MAG: hypothetical protein IPN69_01295 [Acidobacteria bacterium]|nr:hypothetical protein [Acidobacteriota bacterium]